MSVMLLGQPRPRFEPGHAMHELARPFRLSMWEDVALEKRWVLGAVNGGGWPDLLPPCEV